MEQSNACTSISAALPKSSAMCLRLSLSCGVLVVVGSCLVLEGFGVGLPSF